VLLLLFTAGSVAAVDGAPGGAAQEPELAVTPAECLPRGEEERPVVPLEVKGGFLGYGSLGVEGYGGRADQYDYLHSSLAGGLFYRRLGKDAKLDLEGDFLNEHDYRGDLLMDYQGDYRLHLRTESLFHNLGRNLLFTPPFQLGPAGSSVQYLSVQDPPANYALAVTQDSGEFRYRLHNFPLHLTLGYWRLVREGTVQQRFADVSFVSGSPNTVYAQARSVDQRTNEGRLMLDSHLGWVDLIYTFRVREFGDYNGTPAANYLARTNGGAPDQLGGLQQHNENPDSRSLLNTLKLHSSLSGGLVASASYSIEQRENLSTLGDTTGAAHMTVNLQNAAGDLVYTPNREYTFALKYRHQDLDNGGRGPVLSNNFANPLQPVKPPMDTSKDLVYAQFSYHPRNDLTLNGEYRGEYLTRNNVAPLPSATTWALPENASTQSGTLTLYYRPLKGLRTSAQYSYSATDHPSYGSSFQEKHEGKLLATYTRSNSWGASGNLIVRREWNDEVQRFLISEQPTLSYTPFPLLSRGRSTESANLACWWVPVKDLNLGANYAYLHSEVNQAVLFSAISATGNLAASSFFSRSHVYGLNGSYALNAKLELSLMLQQVRSVSAFGPSFTTFSANSDTGGIGNLSREDSVTSYLSARAEYHFTPALTGSLVYNISDYNEKNPVFSAYNGTVHAVFASLGAKW